MKFLVQATGGPGFTSPTEAIQLLEKHVLPTFDLLLKWEKANILSGGLPVGDRAFVFVIEADSNDALDAMIRKVPLWSSLQWEVTPLASFAERVAIDREQLKSLSK